LIASQKTDLKPRIVSKKGTMPINLRAGLSKIRNKYIAPK